jgi:SAM-dependent methyltransferase
MNTVNDRALVEAEYRSEGLHARRASVFANYLQGQNAKDVALEAVIALSPRRVIDIGGGDGNFATAVSVASNAMLELIDTSDRMVELASERSLSATVADIENIPFEDREFDCAVANWMLYHVEDLHRGLSEVARVLTDDGALVAATVGETNLSELWELVGHVGNRDYSFTRENGRARLERAFGAVEMELVDTPVVFPDRAAVIDYVGATIGHAGLAERVPAFDGTFETTARQAVFTARQPLATVRGARGAR